MRTVQTIPSLGNISSCSINFRLYCFIFSVSSPLSTVLPPCPFGRSFFTRALLDSSLYTLFFSLFFCVNSASICIFSVSFCILSCPIPVYEFQFLFSLDPYFCVLSIFMYILSLFISVCISPYSWELSFPILLYILCLFMYTFSAYSCVVFLNPAYFLSPILVHFCALSCILLYLYNVYCLPPSL